MKRLILAVCVIAPVLAHANPRAAVCDSAAELAYNFIEMQYQRRPDLGSAPAHTVDASKAYREACLVGYESGKAHDMSTLNTLMGEIRENASRPLEMDDARMLISNMSAVLAYKAGYLIGNES